MAVPVGLGFDLSAWKEGVRNAAELVRRGLGADVLSPFKAAVKSATGFAKDLFGSTFGQILSAQAIQAGLNSLASGIRAFFWDSTKAADDYQDSLVRARAALATLGDGMNVDAATVKVEQLGKRLALAMGIARAETVDAFSNFVTRGFSQEQAQQLVLLAANYARKAGQPLADISKKVADAANGSVDAIKELGVQISATGNRVKDAEAAVVAMKAAYGEVGLGLADPWDQLSTAVNSVSIELGTLLLPYLEKGVTFASDFVNGLLKSEEGAQALKAVGGAVQWLDGWISKSATSISNLIGMVQSGSKVVINLVKIIVNKAVEYIAQFTNWLVELFPGGKELTKESRAIQEAFAHGADEASASIRAASAEFLASQDRFIQGDSSTGLVGTVSRIAEQGAAIREAAQKDVGAQIAATRGVGFAGAPAVEAERRKAQKELDATAKAYGYNEKKGRKMRGYGNMQSGDDLKIIHTGRDTFRKANSARIWGG